MNKNNIIKIAQNQQDVTARDKEMDKRATEAVRSAISKAEIRNKPIARYDVKEKKAFLEYSDGRRVYV